jgi:D-3-phosphoglycerate dehydrogenase
MRINVTGQYLETNPRIGYVVIDIETGEREETMQLKRRLEEVSGTIRARILY